MNVAGLRPVLLISSRRQPVSLLEIFYEVTFVVDSDERHYFFEAQERSLEQLFRTFETQAFKVLCGRQTRFVFEQMTQARRREVDGRCECCEVEVSAEISGQQIDSLSHTLIHGNNLS